MSSPSSREYVIRLYPKAKLIKSLAMYNNSYIIYDFESPMPVTAQFINCAQFSKLLEETVSKTLGRGNTIRRAWANAEKNINDKIINTFSQ